MKKIKINKLPKGFHRMPDGRIMRDSDHQKMQAGGQPVLGPTPRAAANLEAEKGETVVTDLDNNSIPEHYKIGGKKHSEGGTPLNLPPKSFIFSDHKSMSIKGDDLKKFTNTSKKSMTPAAIAGLKKFDISEENKILKDQDADKMAKATAERNIQAKLVKLGELAMLQESKKDFDNGIPEIALPYLKRNGVTPEQVEMINAELEQRNMMEEMAAFGKEMYGWGGQKKMQGGGQPNVSYAPDALKVFNQYGLTFSLPGATAYADVQKYKGEGLFGDAETNLPGFFEEFAGVYSDLDALKESLDDYGVNDVNPEVKKFQEWYTNTHIPEVANQIRTEVKEKRGYEMTDEEFNGLVAGLTGEFGFQDGKKGFNFDGKMGTVTSGRRRLGYSIDPVEDTPELIPPEIPVYDPEDSSTNFYQQDLVKIGAKLADRANRYYGYTQRLQPYLPNPVFLDPERELQANQEAYATAAATQGLVGRGQNLAGNLSLMQGKLAEQQANTLARYTNANNEIANSFELKRGDAINAFQEYNALQNRQQAMDTAIVNQQYDNFRRQKRNDLANLYAQALTNRAETDLLNDLYPQYSIEPLTGGMGYFTGRGWDPNIDMSAYDKFRQQYLQTVFGGPRTKEEGPAEKKYGGPAFSRMGLSKFIKGK